MNLEEIAKQRYSTKKYNPNKKIPDEIFQQLLELLYYTPSSINSQPFHFIVASTPIGKERIGKSMAAHPFLYNQQKILNASHTIVICSKTDMKREHIQQTLDQAEKDGRLSSADKKHETVDLYMGYINLHKEVKKDLNSWMEKQCYIALGSILLGAAVAGVDATPIEGFDNNILDQEFDLKAQGYTSLVIVTLGYRADDDYNATLPKSRLPKEQLFTIC